jgi:monosaccharide-transporting ATPase
MIRTLTARGLAVMFISHFFDQVFAIRDRATILRNARAVGGAALADTIQTEVATLMLGRNPQARGARRTPPKSAPPSCRCAASGGAAPSRRLIWTCTKAR